MERNAWDGIREDFNQQLGQVFKDICLETLVDMDRRGLLPVRSQRIGKWPRKDQERRPSS